MAVSQQTGARQLGYVATVRIRWYKSQGVPSVLWRWNGAEGSGPKKSQVIRG
jgi:hypothetical protein